MIIDERERDPRELDDDYIYALLDEIKRDEDTIMHEPTVHPDVEFCLERIEANKAEIRRVRGIEN